MNRDVLPITRCVDVSFELAESPIWDDLRKLLWFVDINGPCIHSFDPQREDLRTFPMPTSVGSVGLTADNRLVAALKTGIHIFDPASGSLKFLAHPEQDRPGNRFNDGKVGPDGCFWIGSMDENNTAISGALYRVAPTGDWTRVRDGLFVSNGLAWSPDASTMYHTDGLSQTVKAFDFDVASGTISNERDFFTLDHEEFGWPDGATVDSGGNYWSAGFFKGRVNQISPTGHHLRSIQIPAAGTTMPCLGGVTGKTLFVTSLGVDLEDGRQEGSLFRTDVDVSGMPEYRFGDTAARI